MVAHNTAVSRHQLQLFGHNASGSGHEPVTTVARDVADI